LHRLVHYRRKARLRIAELNFAHDNCPRKI
jgi:hypothetical protein